MRGREGCLCTWVVGSEASLARVRLIACTSVTRICSSVTASTPSCSTAAAVDWATVVVAAVVVVVDWLSEGRTVGPELPLALLPLALPPLALPPLAAVPVVEEFVAVAASGFELGLGLGPEVVVCEGSPCPFADTGPGPCPCADAGPGTGAGTGPGTVVGAELAVVGVDVIGAGRGGPPSSSDDSW